MNPPGPFIDLQVNGYAGLDFNADEITLDEVVRVGQRLADDAVEKVLVTLITAPLETMIRRISRWCEILDQLDGDASLSRFHVFAGFHIEGPFISPVDGYVGAHPREAVRPAGLDAAGRLVDAACGRIRLLTLAPEQDTGGVVTRWLTDQGITVAAGHSDASLDQLKASIDSGLRMYTHLGNGCPAQLPRHDNIIQRVLHLSDQLAISFIADGHHIPCMSLANYLRCVPSRNVIIVTDAISAAGLGPGRYPLGDQTVEVDQDGAAWSADRTHFAGSAATMPSMYATLHDRLGVEQQELQHWMRANPARMIGDE
ncbi:N-acetylglucosamine-6-phosphate deacetylase [Neorhodopirellula pilleata]|uniref:N-acetylglucosamine-6-phosphate deacetylase n=1 Tax=Neorhodopirellula pilleata TaxID=2714738 RepID=A0A5C6AXI8_9BACT|nr:N-acetylglucosamine-6-phosphate deacetylase [Neorhodopirellula pilleata]TWU03879.1 N-acetylglucosamine-6-phosphate deacetylase [Neorhodopirellula pilleata]